jgi:DNA-binding XRE family transcriptional regulator
MKQRRDFKWSAFARDFRQARECQELGLREAARSLGVHHATLCRAEQGKPVEVADFVFLCDWLGVDPKAYPKTRAHNTSPQGIR